MNFTPQQKKVMVSSLELFRLATLQSLRGATESSEVKGYHEGMLEHVNDLLDLVKYDIEGASQDTTEEVVREEVALTDVRVLVAEDNRDSSELLKVILEDMGITHVDVADDGRKSLEAIESAENAYHLILSDWNMPQLSGLQVHAKAKASKSLKGAVYILVSAVSDDVLIAKATRQGLDDFISKPIDPDAIQKKVLSVLNIKP